MLISLEFLQFIPMLLGGFHTCTDHTDGILISKT